VSLFPDIAADDPLLARARSSDRAAWQELYGRYSSAVYTLVRRMVGRPAVAEELMQDAFVEIFRSLPTYQGAGSFGGWVRSIAVSKALMYVRSPLHRWSTERFDDGAHEALAPDAAPVMDSRLVELERALASLPAQTRSIVWLHDVEGMTHAEIAAQYGASVSFSKSQLARAHRQLRALIEHSVGAVVCDSAATN
jgi:RNA polymerase sigma-70 factor (ECF subfamily)